MSPRIWLPSLLAWTLPLIACSSSVEGSIVMDRPEGGDSLGAPAGDADDADTAGDTAVNSGDTGGDSGNANNGDGDGDGGGGLPQPLTHANLIFSGHSLLDHPIPDVVAAIADAKGRGNDWERHNIPGSPMRVRTFGSGGGEWTGYQEGSNRDGVGLDIVAELASPARLASGEHYDTLVITERHDPLDTLVWENSVGYLRDYHDQLAEHAPSRTLFWQSWPDIDKNDPARWISYVREEVAVWECIAAKVNASLVSEGREARVVVAPGALVYARIVEAALAGEVAGLAGSARARLDALFSDNVHPTALASYALGAAAYAAVYGESPEGAAVADTGSPATIADLERIAWEVVSNYPAATRSVRDLTACRTTAIPALCDEYFAIRNRTGNCNGAVANDGPLRWPDSDLPLR